MYFQNFHNESLNLIKKKKRYIRKYEYHLPIAIVRFLYPKDDKFLAPIINSFGMADNDPRKRILLDFVV